MIKVPKKNQTSIGLLLPFIFRFIFGFMFRLRSPTLLFILIASSGPWEKALAKIKTDIGLGSSNNVNLSSSEPVADTFTILSLSGQKVFLGWQASLYGRSQKYQNEINNSTNTLSFSLARDLFENESTNLSFDVFGSQVDYPQGGSSITDTAFNSKNWGGRLTLDWSEESDASDENGDDNGNETSIDQKTDGDARTLELLAQETVFPEFNDRTDRELTLSTSTDSSYLEIALLQSTNTYYSRVSLMGSYDWDLIDTKKWQSQIGLSLKYSIFPDRPLSQSTSPILKGRRSLLRNRLYQEEIETQLLLQIQPSISRIYGNNEVKLAVQFGSQGSKSGTFDYKENSIIASVKTIFN